MIPFFVTIPHSGEKIPPEAQWLVGLPEVVLMGDVDRYVDKLYEKTLIENKIPYITTEWHRYAADLNRLPTDIDAEGVLNNTNAVGTFPRGFHWVYNTHNEKILMQPLNLETHNALVERVYEPFHKLIRENYLKIKSAGFQKVYHCDLHSMPSKGTNQHRDPGQMRADVVISDSQGKSCSKEFVDLVIESYKSTGLSIAYNWPYFGGRLTEQYGKPDLGQHVVQIELNRALYMDEIAKQWIPEKAEILQSKLKIAIEKIQKSVSTLL